MTCQACRKGCGAAAPQILADQKAPPGSGGAPHYYLPPRIFDPCCIPDLKYVSLNFKDKKGAFYKVENMEESPVTVPLLMVPLNNL